MGVFDKAKDKVEDLAKDRMGGNDNQDQNQGENRPGDDLRDKADDAMQGVKDRFNNN
jgi:hypothetical protein